MKEKVVKELKDLSLREIRERQEQLQKDMEDTYSAIAVVCDKVRDEVSALFKGVSVPRDSVYVLEGNLQVSNYIGIQNGVIVQANGILPETLTAVMEIYNKYLS